MQRLGRNAFATALVALAALLAPSTVLLESTPAPARYENISAVTLKTFEDAAGKPVDSVLIIDQSAIRHPAVVALASKITLIGGSLYRASLSATEARTLLGIDGLTLDVNRPTSTSPIKEPTEPTDIPDTIWDAAATVPDTDPALVPTRTSLNIDGSGVLVAVLDTGVDPDALGLGNGKVVHRVDFSSPPSDGSCSDNGELDPYGHGTHVASMIAGATDNRNSAIQGVAPGASIIDLRVLNCAGSGYMSSTDEALQWILDHRVDYPVKVVNLSLGSVDERRDGLDSTSILVNRLVAQGIFVAIAAGNSGDAAGTITAPGAAEFATTVAAATVNKYGKFLSQFSSIGPTSDGRPGIDITAPGGGIRAALTTAKVFGSNYETTMSGTSMATPYVAGIAALLIQQHPDLLPTGSLCDLGAACPSGVVKASMDNGIQSLMKTSDWFEPGVDAKSGAGMVSASASLLGTSIAPAKFERLTLDGASDNVLRFAPHNTGFTISMLLDTSYRTDMWDKVGSFSVAYVDENYNSSNKSVVCTLLAETSCLFGAMSFTPRLFTYYVPASTTPQAFVIRTARTLSLGVNIDGFAGDLAFGNGVKISNVSVANGPATITVERTLDSSTAVTYSISHTGNLSTPLQVTLPAGAVGTQATFQVSSTGASLSSSERVVLKDPTGVMIGARVGTRTAGDGPLEYPNNLGYDNSSNPSPIFIADDGSILGSSAAQGMTNSSGYGNPFRVAAGSRTVEKYLINQTTTTQIDPIALAQDGSTAIFMEFPAGSGIVPGDESLNYNYFTRNFATGANYEVGPDWSQWANWYEAKTPVMTISEDGSSVVWATIYPTGENPIVVVKQSGAGFSVKTTLDSFPGSYAIDLFGTSHGRTLVRVRDGANIDEIRAYTGVKTYQVLAGNTFNAWSASFSANGQAIAMHNPNSDELSCNLNGVVTTFAMPRQLGMSFFGSIRVANDCSWVQMTWEKAPSFPRGTLGIQLLKIYSDGTVTRLDQSPGKANTIRWVSNLAGTIFLRVSSLQLEPGDLNGESDTYRGLGMSTPESVHLRRSTHVFFDMNLGALTFGSKRLLGSTTESDGAITYRVNNGPCHIDGNYVVADSGQGSCVLEVLAAETDSYLATGGAANINLVKRQLTSANLRIDVPNSVSVGSPTAYTVFNPDNLAITNVWVEGASCSIANGMLTALEVGICRVRLTRFENENDLGFAAYRDVTVTKGTFASESLMVSAPESLRAGQTFTPVVTNNTGLANSLFTTGGCSISNGVVTLDQTETSCTVSVRVAESRNYLAKVATAVVTKTFPLTNVTTRLADRDWTSAKLLPKGSTLSFNANVTVISGGCRANGPEVLAISPTGTCVIRIGGYDSQRFSYSTLSMTIKLGPALQTWTTTLPTYTSKKITAQKFAFITNGSPKTNLGIAGAFTVTAGCKITTSGKTVTLDMGRTKKCVATLKAAAGFRVPGLTKTWTFTR